MQYKNNTKQRFNTIQGLRSLKDTLPKNIKKVINNRGQVYSEILNNWKIIAGESLFKVCYPKSFKSSNKFGLSTLLIMVQRGHEVDLEYSRNSIIHKMNLFFGYSVIEKIKIVTFEDENDKIKEKNVINLKNDKDLKKISYVKNEKIRKSLLKLSKLMKKK